MKNTLKKYYTIICTIILFTSCSDSSSSNKEKEVTNKTNRIENFVLSFAKDNPNWAQNSINNERIDKNFKDSVIKLYHTEGIFDSYTFKFENINEYSKDKFAAKFKNINENLTDTKKISVEVIGLVDNKIVSQLTNGQTYQLSGEFVKLLDEDLKNYFNHGFFNINVGFEPLVDNTYFLGTALIKIKKVTPAN
jgi:PBP1b-binding outer membrane lipoprotein LpoB